MFLCWLKSMKALYVSKESISVGWAATVDLSPTHTQHFLPHPKLKLLPVSGQPFPLPPPIQKQPARPCVVHRPPAEEHSQNSYQELPLPSLYYKDYSSEHTLTLEVL